MKPCTKIKHLTRKAAEKAAHRMFESTGSKCLVYKCEKCHGWHIGRPSMYKNPDLYNQNVNKLFENIGVKNGKRP